MTSRGRRLEIRRLPAVLGCRPPADVLLVHDSVAPRHALLSEGADGALTISALQGALVEVAGWRVEQGLLTHGDELLLGRLRLRLLDDRAVAPASAPSAAADAAGDGGTATRPAAIEDEALQLRRPAATPTAKGLARTAPGRPRARRTGPLLPRRDECRHGLLQTDLSQFGALQKAAIVTLLLALCAALAWGLGTTVSATL